MLYASSSLPLLKTGFVAGGANTPKEASWICPPDIDTSLGVGWFNPEPSSLWIWFRAIF
jgi:hypothetical protein